MTSPAKPIVLVVDDEPAIREFLKRLNASRERQTVTAGTVEEALGCFRDDMLDLAILDMKLPDGSGIDLLKRIREVDPTLPVMMFTGHGTIEMAVEAMRLGAVDFIQKPLEMGPLEARIEKALEMGSLRREVQRLRGKLGNLSEAGLIGRSRPIRDLVAKIRRVAEAPSTTVLIEGESGSGKELVARAVHLASGRRSRRFLAINCAALSESLLEAELFGYERGSFTGASSAGKLGLFQAADGGTLLLDEIGEMSLGLQTKLLRVIQERQVRRVGGVEGVPIDVRLVAATNRNLQQEVERGTFRKDLFYRLNVMRIRTPPLRERPSDIPILAQHFLDVCLEEIPRPIRGFAKSAMAALKAHEWPGNVRELKNVIERAVINAPGPLIRERHLDLLDMGEGSPPNSARRAEPQAGAAAAAGAVTFSGEGLTVLAASGFGASVAGYAPAPAPASKPAVRTASPPAALHEDGRADDDDDDDAGDDGHVGRDDADDPGTGADADLEADARDAASPDEEDAAPGHRLRLEDLSIACAECELIKLVLKETGWNRSRAAGLLGINRTTLYDKLKLYGIAPPPKKARAATGV